MRVDLLHRRRIGERIESRIAEVGCLLQQRDQLRLGSRWTRARRRLSAHDPLAYEQICGGDMRDALPEALDLGRRLKAIVLCRHFFRHLEKVVTDNGPRELRLRHQRLWVLRGKQTATDECQEEQPAHGCILAVFPVFATDASVPDAIIPTRTRGGRYRVCREAYPDNQT